MAEKDKKQEKVPAEPTKRVLLAGFELPVEQVAKALVEAGWGRTANDPPLSADPAAKKRLIADATKAIAVEGDDGKVAIGYVAIGPITGADKRKAIEAAVGENTLGIYRAPSASAWRDGVLKVPPKDIAPDVRTLD